MYVWAKLLNKTNLLFYKLLTQFKRSFFFKRKMIHMILKSIVYTKKGCSINPDP